MDDIRNLVVLYIVGVAGAQINGGKNMPDNACMNYYQDGDYILGGMFPIRYVYPPLICAGEGGGLSPWGTSNMESMVFAVNYINSLPDLLPNITLGFDLRDDCRSEYVALFQATTLASYSGPEEFKHVCERSPNSGGYGGNTSVDRSISKADTNYTSDNSRRKQTIAVIGTAEDQTTFLTAHVGSVNRVPVISYGAGSDDLSDNERFPFFARTVPPDEGQLAGIADLLLHYNWLYIGVIYSLDNNGLFASQHFKTLVEPGICIAYFEPVSRTTSEDDLQAIVDKIKDYEMATVIVMLVFDNQVALPVLRALRDNGISVTIICSTGSGHGLIRRDLGEVTYGSFFYRELDQDVPEFADYFHALDPNTTRVSPWFKEYYKDTGEVPDSSGNPSVINAVSVVAYALHALITQECERNAECETVAAPTIAGDQLLKFIKNVSFPTILGDVFEFDSQGEAAAAYNILNMQTDPDVGYKQSTIGQWLANNPQGNKLKLNEDEIHFKNNKVPKSLCRQDCLPGSYPVPLARKCCWGCRFCPANAIVMKQECHACQNTHWPDDTRTTCEKIEPIVISWKDPIIIVIYVLTGIGLLISGFVSLGLVLFLNHPLIKSTSRELSGINIIGLKVTFIAVFLFLARPSNVTCIFSEAILSLSFTITYAPTMLKVNRIYRIFKSGRKSVKRPRWIGPRPQIIMCLALILIQVVISVISSMVSPSRPTLLIPNPPRNHVELYCSFGYSFIASVAYNLLIVLTCCVYAFRARKVPANYNESRFIAVSVYSTLVVSLATVPVYSTSDEILPKVATICLALLLNAYQTLACVYLPKLYAILFVGDGGMEIDDWRSTMIRTIQKSRVHPDENGDDGGEASTSKTTDATTSSSYARNNRGRISHAADVDLM